jgi:hypothetical protein
MREIAKPERPKQKAVLDRVQQQLIEAGPQVRLRPSQALSSAHPEYPDAHNQPCDECELYLMNILGLDIDFVRGFVYHLAEACTHGELVDDRKLNFVFSTIKLYKPRDPLEVMAVAQSALLFAANTKTKQDYDDAETPEQRQGPHRSLAQGVRAYTSLMGETKRYRTGGEQRLVVQYQNVSMAQGAQAIVGQVAHTSQSEAQ